MLAMSGLEHTLSNDMLSCLRRVSANTFNEAEICQISACLYGRRSPALC